MKSEELKRAMLATAEAEIEAIVAWEGAQERMTLTEIEEKLLAARQRVSQAWARQIIEQREVRRNAEIPEDAESGRRLHAKGKKTKRL
jgi:hypothetical protein